MWWRATPGGPGRLARRRILLTSRIGGAWSRGARIAAALVLVLGASSPLIAAENCPDRYGPPLRVVSIDRFGDLVLADGVTVRLAALSVPGDEANATRRLNVLRDAAAGRDVVLAGADDASDRYGRRAALMRIAGEEETLQARLLAEGLALAQPEAGFLGCMTGLVASEARARAAKRGMWARLPVSAHNETAAGAREGEFTILAGRVLSIGNGRQVDYLNFGPVWRHDTTVRLEKPVRAALERAGVPLESLAGRRVAVRGVVVEAGGPAIDVRWIEQLELIDAR